MPEGIPTIGGRATRSEVYTKLLHHLIEVQELCAVMAHLHNTESNKMDQLLAKGWLGMSELFKKIQHQVTDLAMGKLLS
jgi:hypothetical protein